MNDVRKSILYCLLIFAVTVPLLSCGSQEVSSSEDKTVQAEVTEEPAEVPEESDAGPLSKEQGDLLELSPEEQFDNVFSFFADNGNAGKSRHSLITDATYYAGVSKEDNQIQFMYISEDKSQGVLLSLDREGRFGILVNIKSGNEGVIGTVDMKASDYTYGYEFADFTYQSNQRDWDYEKFKLRANAYVRDTMLYADSILQDNLKIDLNDLGFSAWENPGMYSNGYISTDDVAGLWDYKSSDEKTYSSKLYLTGDKIYWRGYEETYADAITSSAMTESEEYLLSQGMIMSMTDPYTGEAVIIDDYAGNDDTTHEQFRRYIYRNTDGTLCMRVESVYLGMSNNEDGKVYVKVDDESETSIAPKFYYPSDTEGLEGQKVVPSESENEDTPVPSGNSTYQSILDEYTSKMERAVPGLVQEYKTESAGISDINRLAELCNDKVGELAEICNEGVSEMAEIMYMKGDAYETYEKWAGALMDNYSDIAAEIQDAYLESATY